MTQRREQTKALAGALGVEVLPGEGTADLMDRCIEAAHDLKRGGGGKAPRSDREERAARKRAGRAGGGRRRQAEQQSEAAEAAE